MMPTSGFKIVFILSIIWHSALLMEDKIRQDSDKMDDSLIPHQQKLIKQLRNLSRERGHISSSSSGSDFRMKHDRLKRQIRYNPCYFNPSSCFDLQAGYGGRMGQNNKNPIRYQPCFFNVPIIGCLIGRRK